MIGTPPRAVFITCNCCHEAIQGQLTFRRPDPVIYPTLVGTQCPHCHQWYSVVFASPRSMPSTVFLMDNAHTITDSITVSMSHEPDPELRDEEGWEWIR